MRIGIADTCFARIPMGEIAQDVVKREVPELEIERYTVPGFKDLPVACKKLIDDHNCDIVVALGWVGKEKIDELCAHEANIGLIQAELMTNTHILKVFFHETEAVDNEKRQYDIALHRVEEHTRNALLLLKGKETLQKSAGRGKRQGYDDAGRIEK